jgi:hypothetical protein
MLQPLSNFLQRRADNQFDGRVPEATKSYIAAVARDERDLARSVGPIETARQTLVGSYVEFGDAYGYLRAVDELAASNPGDPVIKEARQRARSEVLGALEWLESARLAMSQAVRQAQQDAVQSAGASEGRAA